MKRIHGAGFIVYVLMNVVIFALCNTAFAAVPDFERWKHMRTIKPEQYICYRTLGSIQIDGKLDETSWKSAPWTNYFIDIEGDLKPIPRFKTRVKMLWDDYYFYIAADMEEPHVWGTLIFRDQIICIENDFEVFIDPNGDNHEYYEIEIGPLNTVWDLFLRVAYKDGRFSPETGRPVADHTWECRGIKTAVSVDGTINDPRDIDKKWSVEFAFPWKTLAEFAHRPCPPQNGDQWRVNFSRVEWLHEIVTSEHTTKDITNNAYRKKKDVPCDNWTWSNQGVINMHCPEMFGYVQFSTAPMGQDEFRPDPTFPARLILHDIYYAQRDYYQNNENWAHTLEELGLDYSGDKSILKTPVIEPTENGFRAGVTVRCSDGSSRTMYIRQDARIWEE